MSSKKIQMGFFVGGRIKLLRLKAGLKQEDFAQLLNVTTNTISRYEKGHRLPDSDFLNHLVDATQCDPGWLLTGEGEITQASAVSEKTGSYNEDPELDEIDRILTEEIPEKKEYILGILHGILASKGEKSKKKAADERQQKREAG